MEPLLAEAAAPTFDAAYFLALASRLAHTTCAATLLGGLIYLRCVVAPRAADADDAEAALYADRRRSWAGIVGVATLLLLVSGFYNLVTIVSAYDNLPKLYHPLFGVKFLLALGVMAIAALLAGKTALAKRLQSSAVVWLNAAIALAVATFLVGAMLRSFRDLPEARAPAAASVVDEAPAASE